MGSHPMVTERRSRHNKITYIEFAAIDFDATKAFFMQVFGWEFNDYGQDYTAYEGFGVDFGFYRADMQSLSEKGSALPVFYSENLEETERKVRRAGGTIVKEIFEFPGGRRFQFLEPSGNEIGVWSDVDESGNQPKLV